MVTLNTCGKEGCNPVEQMRGEMRPEDHHSQFNLYDAAKKFTEEHGVALPLKAFYDDVYEVEDMGPENSSDIRISCSKCGKSIGWGRSDIEEFKKHAPGDTRRHVVTRDGNKDNVRSIWNRIVKDYSSV